MARLKISKIQMIFLQKDSKSLLGELQRLGVTELTEISDERLERISVRSQTTLLERNLRIAEDCLDVINKYSPPDGGIGAMFSGRDPISFEEYSNKAADTDRLCRFASSICDTAKAVAEYKSEIGKRELAIEQLTMWESLDIPMQKAGTAKCSIYTGTFPDEQSAEMITSKISEKVPDCAFDLTVISTGAGQTAVSIVVFADDAESLYSAIREMGFTKPADPTKHPPAVRKNRLLDEIKELGEKVEESEKILTDASENRDDIKFLCDYLTVRRDEYLELEKVGVGDTVMVCSGYIPDKYIPDAKRLIEKYCAVVEFTEPSDEDDTPVLLENGSFAGPMESVVEMYSMPGKKDIDPSAVMAFFYYFLFGMMLSDAGYGILMTVFSAVVLKRSTVEGSMAKMLKMFFWCGISTTIWGVLFGSFFGDIIPVICTEFLGLPAPDMALWFTPIDNAITLLLFSLGIGILHLLLGLGTAIVIKCREGHALDGILDNVPTMLLLIGVAPLGASVFVTVPSVLSTIGAVLALIGVAGIILFTSRSSKNIFARLGGGLYGLYNNVSGYMSDILSYSRLLALGLATGSIAEVFNMIGTMPENPVLKGILLTVVFIVGHSLNMAINLLGAYVHTVRLQFVELLPKFYEGGGRAMKPFAMNTKYFKIRKDKSAE
ncbi:MAG: V-type ATP synthase subunit I [Clostridia bacterium]|nr:V-type ATP synthase subunit I [Clostridia bacterium]